MRQFREMPTEVKAVVATSGFALIGVYNTFRLMISGLSSLIAYAFNETEGAAPTLIALTVVALACCNLMRYLSTPAEQQSVSQKKPIPNDELFRLTNKNIATMISQQDAAAAQSDKAVEVLAQGLKKQLAEEANNNAATIDNNVAELNKKIMPETKKSSNEEMANELMQEVAPGPGLTA